MVDNGGGSIVNVASIWGLVGVGQIPEAGYAASKGGLVNLTRELAAQWAREGRAREHARAGLVPHRDDRRSDVRLRVGREVDAQRTPMGRGGDEHELDGALLFLASDASTFVTGAVISVDGGWTASRASRAEPPNPPGT